MRRLTARLALVALAFACLLASPASDLSLATGRPRPSPGATIEPVLPLTVDLRVASVHEGRGGGGSARLEAEIEAGPEIREASLILVLPDGLRAEAGALATGITIPLAAAERRLYAVPLRAERAGSFPIRLHVSFSLPDGRTFQTQQGATLRVGPRPEWPRSNAGASEYMAVPLAEPLP
jgi:hypothetical protein